MTGLSTAIHTDSSATSIVSQLQLYYMQTGTMVKLMSLKPFFENIAGAFAIPFISIIFYAGFFIGSFALIMALIVNLLSFFVLLAIAPVAFYFLIFGNFTKQIFVQWFNMILSNTLTLILLHLFGNIIFGLSRSIGTSLISSIDSTDLSYWKAGAVWFMTGLVIKFYSGLVVSLAEKLTQVSLESASSALAGKGLAIAGAGVGLGALTARNTIFGGASLGGKGIKGIYNKLKANQKKGEQ